MHLATEFPLEEKHIFSSVILSLFTTSNSFCGCAALTRHNAIASCSLGILPFQQSSGANTKLLSRGLPIICSISIVLEYQPSSYMLYYPGASALVLQDCES